MALTFTSSWVAAVSLSGGPTPPTPTFTDSTNAAKQEDNLYVEMGNYQGATKVASSTIDLTRNINISASSQGVEFEHDLLAEFKQAGAAVTVSVRDSAGRTVVTPIQFNRQNQSADPTYFATFQQEFANVKKGDYTLDVKARYFTNNKVGGWKSISGFHHFEFEGE